MDAAANGLVTIVNGIAGIVGRLVDPTVLVTGLIGMSLLWLALIELDELNRQGTKPDIGRGL